MIELPPPPRLHRYRIDYREAGKVRPLRIVAHVWSSSAEEAAESLLAVESFYHPDRPAPTIERLAPAPAR